MGFPFTFSSCFSIMAIQEQKIYKWVYQFFTTAPSRRNTDMDFQDSGIPQSRIAIYIIARLEFAAP